ncbi:hypothetical protein [Lachnospira multipara]|uniref:Uncharacterized protein n=1 Tax=Lachnospira multipara TaxID=28051 RepID=A0A1H5VRQ1_9FIRM|nr:hypothetical protein [Lachnospira multipara]SEF89813.1 hypothetical protein SAMN05216537_11250 [Lachnospira multipara]
MFYKVIHSVILGVIAASFAIGFLNGVLPLIANKYDDNIERKVKALKTILISATCALLATIALIFIL